MGKNFSKNLAAKPVVKKEEVKMEVKDQVVEENTLVDAEASETVQEITEEVQTTVLEEVKEEVVDQKVAEENPATDTESQVPAEIAPENQENIPEDKKETEELKNESKIQVSESYKSMKIINSLIAKNSGLKIVATESKTGISYFSGKKRLCKLLKTKRGVTLEINVSLPKQFKDLAEMETISATVAFKKHLGTMKHLYKPNDARMIGIIMKEAIAVFRSEIEAEKAKDQVQEKQVVNQ
jgi:hypothetical protein